MAKTPQKEEAKNNLYKFGIDRKQSRCILINGHARKLNINSSLWENFIQLKPKDEPASKVIRKLIFDYCEEEFRKKVRGENIDRNTAEITKSRV